MRNINDCMIYYDIRDIKEDDFCNKIYMKMEWITVMTYRNLSRDFNSLNFLDVYFLNEIRDFVQYNKKTGVGKNEQT